MTTIDIIRAVNSRTITIRAALQIMHHKNISDAKRVLEYYRNSKNKINVAPVENLPRKISALAEQIRQELG